MLLVTGSSDKLIGSGVDDVASIYGDVGIVDAASDLGRKIEEMRRSRCHARHVDTAGRIPRCVVTDTVVFAQNKVKVREGYAVGRGEAQAGVDDQVIYMTMTGPKDRVDNSGEVSHSPKAYCGVFNLVTRCSQLWRARGGGS